MTTESYLTMTDEKLIHTVLQLETDLVSARFRHSMNQLENTGTLKALRREIARLRTEAGSRERKNDLAKDHLMHAYRRTRSAGEVTDAPESEEAAGGFLSGIVDKLTAKG